MMADRARILKLCFAEQESLRQPVGRVDVRQARRQGQFRLHAVKFSSPYTCLTT